MPNFVVSPRLRKSPFYEATIRDGVSDFTVYNKMLLPLSFGDLEAEYDRLMNHVAMWDVASERQVEISGSDRHKLTQYLCARDLSKMVVGQGKYVALCDHQGRILNDPVLLKLEDRYWISLADADILLWVKAVAAEGNFDVDVCEPDVSPLAIQGPQAENLAVDLFGEWVKDLRYFWFKETAVDGIPLVLCRSGWSKQGGFELFLQDGSRGEQLYELVKAAGEKYGIGPGAPNHVERVESGLLSWGGDTTYDTTPFEAGMGGYVDIDIEPDFIGKAALIDASKSGDARLFVGLTLDGDAPSAWPLEERVPVTVDGRQVGTMSAIVYSPRLGRTIGLAQIMQTAAEPGTEVTVPAPWGISTATVTSLPFL